MITPAMPVNDDAQRATPRIGTRSAQTIAPGGSGHAAPRTEGSRPCTMPAAPAAHCALQTSPIFRSGLNGMTTGAIDCDSRKRATGMVSDEDRKTSGFSRRKHILICDDDQIYIKKFIKNHSNHYDIEFISDPSELQHKLGNLNYKPDLILLDLFYKKDDAVDSVVHEVDSKLDQIERDYRALRPKVDETYEPRGLFMLADLHKYNLQIPVAVTTQRGIMLLKDDEMKELEQNKGHWLLRKCDSTPQMEKMRLDSIIRQSYADYRLGEFEAIVRYLKYALIVSWIVLVSIIGCMGPI